MPTTKPDTSGGFAPAIRPGRDIAAPAVDVLRLDGLLERSVLSPKIHQLLQSLVRVRNAVSSFRLEGERVELDRARALVEGEAAHTASEKGVVRLAKAYSELAAGRLPALTVDGIRGVHRDLFNGLLSDDRGTLRDDWVGVLKPDQNYVVDATGVRFVPTPPARTKKELQALLDWYGSVRNLWQPPVVAALFFAEFQGIHPFMDGNGRVGRLLNTAVLVDMGCKQAPLAPIDLRFLRSSERYYEFLASTNSGRRYDLWTRYFVGEVLHAYRLARSQADLNVVVNRFSRPSTQALLRWILGGSGGWFASGDYPNPKHYSQPALWAALDELRRAGIVEAQGDRRGRKYRLDPTFLPEFYPSRL